MHDTKWKSAFRRKMLKWFSLHQRDLPWRQNKTPYRIWVSEIMLQQTQVVTVVDFFNRFILAFPTVEKLAAAKEAEVLKLWEGLGYYRRARQMHRAAQIIVDEHEGKFPVDFESVVKLPGIGRYTAGAILSIALDQRQPILEGNTIRLFARLLEMKSNPRHTQNQKILWEFSTSLLPRKQCGDFNQSLMELGSEICHPKRPKCLICPVHNLCPTAIKGLQTTIPVAAPKVKYESVNEAIVVIRRRSKFLVKQYAEGGRWAGLWDFPRFNLNLSQSNHDNSGNLKRVDGSSRLGDLLKDQTGLIVKIQKTDRQIKHAVTRFKITLDCYIANHVSGRLTKNQENYTWMTLAEIEAAPMSVTARKIATVIRDTNCKI